MLVEERNAIAIEEEKNDRAGQRLRQDQFCTPIEAFDSLSPENPSSEAHHIALLTSHYSSPSDQVQRVANPASHNRTKIGNSSTFLNRSSFCLRGIVKAIETTSEDCSPNQRVQIPFEEVLDSMIADDAFQ